MNRLALAALLLSLSGVALAQAPAAAEAVEPVQAAEPAIAAEPAEPVDVVVLAADADQVKKPMSDRNCLRSTGTHISARSRRGECVNAPGRSYSGDELARTGAATTAEALELLDPSISISR